MPEVLQIAFLVALVYGFHALHRIASAAEAGKFQVQSHHIRTESIHYNGCNIENAGGTDAS